MAFLFIEEKSSTRVDYMNSKISTFVKTLQEKKLTIAFAESITCGLVAQKLATCPGTSDILKGAIVCYSPEVKKELLKISARTIRRYSCESLQVTRKLAQNLAPLIKADIHAAITGLASPGGSESKSKPVGTVFICAVYKGKIHSERKQFRGSPLTIRTKACMALYNMVLEILDKKQ
jgi:nicotinamide-nucleotide amidase